MTLKEQYLQLADETHSLNRAYGLAVKNHWFGLATKLEPMLEGLAYQRDTLKQQIDKEESTRRTSQTLMPFVTSQTVAPATLTLTGLSGAPHTAYLYTLTGKITP
jgi:hypothetical protein